MTVQKPSSRKGNTMKPMLSRSLVPACFFAILTVANAQPATTSSPTWHVYFSPGGLATFAIRQAIDNAKLLGESALVRELQEQPKKWITR